LKFARVALAICAATAFAGPLVFKLSEPNVLEARLDRVTAKNGDRRTTLEALFREVGCDGDRLTTQVVDKKSEPNVICTLPADSDRIILVGAHFDTVKGSPGVSDNWSGAALLPSLFEVINRSARRHTFVFVGFTDEEKGLVGSRHYVKKLSKEDKARHIAMINLDSLGLGEINYWETRANPALVKHYINLAGAMKYPLYKIELSPWFTTDVESFHMANIPSIGFASVTKDNVSNLHTLRDRKEIIDLNKYYATYRLLSAYLTYLDQNLE
jgi:hypothetical protein